MHDDGVGAVAGLADGAALLAFLRVGQCLLIGPIGNADAFEADTQPRLIHHREHALHAAIFFADQVTDRAAIIAHRHDAGGGGVNAELVLDATGKDIIACAKRAIGIDQEFRDQKQRYAFRPRRRVRQSCQHKMHDIVGHIVLAIGDEDLGPADAVGAVRSALRACAQQADVGTGLRLGQVHGAGPLAGDQFGEVDILELVTAVRIERLDRAQREQRAQPERHVRCAPDLGAGRIDGHRQALAAECLGPRDRVPSGIRPALVGIGPARCSGHLAVGKFDAVLVADPVQRSEHVGCEPAGFFQHRGRDVAIVIAIVTCLHGGLQAGSVVEGEQDIGYGCAIGHDDTFGLLTWPPSVVFP